MTKNMSLSWVMILIILFGSACNLSQPSPVAIPTEIAITTEISTVNPTSTQIIAPTSTLTPTSSPAPSLTASPTQEITGPFQVIASLDDVLEDSSGPLQLHVLDDASVWVISQHRVLRWDGSSWKEMFSSSSDMLADVDAAGRLWILSPDSQAISNLQGEDWISYDTSSGWMDTGQLDYIGWVSSTWGIYLGSGNTLWVPMSRDVRSFDGNRWTVYTLEDMGFPSPDLEDLIIVHSLVTADNSSEVWVGECYYSGPGPMGGGGVRWFDGQAWHGADAPVGANCVSAMHVDQAGNIWLGAYTEIWRYDPSRQSWTYYILPRALLADFNFAYPLQLSVDHAGDVWVIMQMCGGASCGVATNLYRIHHSEWSLILESQNWSSSLRQLVLDADGRPWLFWENMLYRLEGDTTEPVAPINPRAVGVGPAGTIWLVAESESGTNLLILNP